MSWLFGKKSKKVEEKPKVNVADVKEKLDKQIEFTGMNVNKYETLKHLSRKPAQNRLCLFADGKSKRENRGAAGEVEEVVLAGAAGETGSWLPRVPHRPPLTFIYLLIFINQGVNSLIN